MRDSRPVWIALIFNVLAAWILAACGGQTAGAPSPSPSPGSTTVTVTLGETGCRYDGPSQAPAGRLIAHLVNQTKNAFFLELGRIESGHAFQDFVEWTDRDRDREIHGQHSVGPPDWMTGISSGQADPGVTAQLEAAVGKGTYAFACGRLDFTVSPPKELGVWAAGPLDVS